MVNTKIGTGYQAAFALLGFTIILFFVTAINPIREIGGYALFASAAIAFIFLVRHVMHLYKNSRQTAAVKP